MQTWAGNTEQSGDIWKPNPMVLVWTPLVRGSWYPFGLRRRYGQVHDKMIFGCSRGFRLDFTSTVITENFTNLMLIRHGYVSYVSGSSWSHHALNRHVFSWSRCLTVTGFYQRPALLKKNFTSDFSWVGVSGEWAGIQRLRGIDSTDVVSLTELRIANSLRCSIHGDVCFWFEASCN